ncbi:MAG TPA: hypothetical protein VGK01_20770 [Candidatus Angelobacter sp.]|jgi:hypothetical protein
MRFKVMLSFIVLAVCCSAAYGQQTQPATVEPVKATTTEAAPASVSIDKLILKDGSDVKLKFAEAVSSKTATDGDPVNLVLDEDLKVGNVVVAKAGSKAVGTVTHAKKAGMMGKGGANSTCVLSI